MGVIVALLAWAPWRASDPETEVRVFTAYDVDGKLASSINVTETAVGTCWTIAQSTFRPDALRCSTVSGTDVWILDPCFSFFVANDSAVCMQDRFDAILLLAPEGEPLWVGPGSPDGMWSRAEAVHETYAWVLELTDGTVCTFLGGVGIMFAGRRVAYECSDGGSLLDVPTAVTGVWKVDYLSRDEATTITRSVRTVWR